MLEIFIERWSGPDGVRYPWSVWRDGRQVHGSHGAADYDDPLASEADAVEFCRTVLRRPADAVTRL